MLLFQRASVVQKLFEASCFFAEKQQNLEDLSVQTFNVTKQCTTQVLLCTAQLHTHNTFTGPTK